MDKNERLKLLMELERLVELDGDVNRIFDIREQLGMNEPKAKEQKVDPSKYPFTEEQFFRLRALGLINIQISFALKVNPSLVHAFVSCFTKEELKRRTAEYDDHYVIKNFKRSRRITS